MTPLERQLLREAAQHERKLGYLYGLLKTAQGSLEEFRMRCDTLEDAIAICGETYKTKGYVYTERCPICGQPAFVAGEGITHWYQSCSTELLKFLKHLLRKLRRLPDTNDVRQEIKNLLNKVADTSVLEPYIATIRVPQEKLDKYEELCNTANIDYSKYGIKKDSVVETFTAQFENGMEMDIKVCAGQSNEPLWTEAVLFNKGYEVTHTDVCDELEGDWIIWDRAQEYIVTVIGDNNQQSSNTERKEDEKDDA